MPPPQSPAQEIARHPFRFLWRVINAFGANQGILLSGAVAYNGLLSLIPLLGLLLVGLSHFMEPEPLLETIKTNLSLILPAEADTLTHEVGAFLDHRHLVGWIGTLMLLFFSTIAFTVLEKAMAAIFHHREETHSRHPLVSAAIPFAFILLIGVGILLITFINGALQTLGNKPMLLLGQTWDLSGAAGMVLYLLGVAGLILLLSALYLVMPTGNLSFRLALIGGVTAGLLWEAVRHLLVWYFASLSLVNIIYGSLASAIVALLSFEAAAFILLFGAQVIAEYEQLQREMKDKALLDPERDIPAGK
ncbi:MAG: ribonuclease R [Gammaproteobacteria bacterium RIFOXYA12_FULL_61_12]|nr:MAG: ribonuclease R [Gammaproteobacteria bacterium RIFOXYD12_FULL_61_37]OGT92469.1 MAG: ribonuclease R [Gammaproteobacteria bacterium RIFOXYA12_FULL_61_12]